MTKANLSAFQTIALELLAGAEPFTGNNLIIMAWADEKVSSGQLLRNWGWSTWLILLEPMQPRLLFTILGCCNLAGAALPNPQWQSPARKRKFRFSKLSYAD